MSWLWDDRLAEVWAWPGKAGSGVVIGDRGVLTARHVVAEACEEDYRPGRLYARTVRRGDTASPWVPVRVVGDDPEWDLAVLEVDLATPQASSWVSPTSASPALATLGSTVEHDCEAVGFPDEEIQRGKDSGPGDQVRQPEQVWGQLLPMGQAKPPMAPWMPLDISSATPAQQAGCGGMSGAGVLLSDGCLIGVVVGAQAAHHQRRLFVAPLATAVASSPRVTEALAMVASTPVIEKEICPYRGLEAFADEHAEWFHGRAVAIDAVLTGLAAHPQAILLLGPSGAGKTSLVQAGVLPALAAGRLSGSDRWIAVLARPRRGLAGLDCTYLPWAGTGDSPIAVAVERRLAGEPPGVRLLLVIDQFEELLTPTASSDEDQIQRKTLDDIAAAIGKPALTVVLVMRDDFYPRLASQAPELLQALTPGLVNVPATLNSQDIREIIIRPAESVGLRCQDQLPERIITDVLALHPETTAARRAPITVLPLLELMLEQLWQRRRNSYLTHEAYQRIGGVSGSLTTWCDAAIEQLPPAQRPTAQRILTALVRPADETHQIPAVRQQVPLAALRDLADPTDSASDGEQSDHTVDQVLAALTAHGIVATRTIYTTGQPDDTALPVAELVHDALIRDWPTLGRWLAQDHRFKDWLRRAGDHHSRWTTRHEPGDLLHSSDLTKGLSWSRQRPLPKEINDFLTRSRRFQQAGIRRIRRLNSILAVLLIMAVAATAVAFSQRQSAVAAQKLALSRQLAAQSTALMGSDPDLAALLAVQAYQTSPTNQAASALYTAAAYPLLRRFTGHTGVVSSVAFSRDGHSLATAGWDKTVRLWDPASGQTRTTLTGHTDVVSSVAFSPDGRSLATASYDNTVRLWDLASGQTRTTLTGHTGAVSSVAFSPNGRSLATASSDNTVRLWDLASGQTRATLTGHTNVVSSVAFSPDGGSLATASFDDTVRLWKMSLPDPTSAINKICRAIGRDLTPQERATYLPSADSPPACAP